MSKTASSYYIEGYVCATSGGEVFAENLTIGLDAYVKDKDGGR